MLLSTQKLEVDRNKWTQLETKTTKTPRHEPRDGPQSPTAREWERERERERESRERES